MELTTLVSQILLRSGLHQVGKKPHHQKTYFCNYKTKTITVPTPNLDFCAPTLIESNRENLKNGGEFVSKASSNSKLG